MTLAEAIARLSKRWPEISFAIECQVWSHVHHDGRQEPEVLWSIYHAGRNKHYHGPSLDTAMECAIPSPAALAQAEAAIQSFDVSSVAGEIFPCDICGEPRPPGIQHICPQAFMAQERRLMGLDSSEVPI